MPACSQTPAPGKHSLLFVWVLLVIKVGPKGHCGHQNRSPAPVIRRQETLPQLRRSALSAGWMRTAGFLFVDLFPFFTSRDSSQVLQMHPRGAWHALRLSDPTWGGFSFRCRRQGMEVYIGWNPWNPLAECGMVKSPRLGVSAFLVTIRWLGQGSDVFWVSVSRSVEMAGDDLPHVVTSLLLRWGFTDGATCSFRCHLCTLWCPATPTRVGAAGSVKVQEGGDGTGFLRLPMWPGWCRAHPDTCCTRASEPQASLGRKRSLFWTILGRMLRRIIFDHELQNIFAFSSFK